MRDSYHHGSLRDALVETALAVVQEVGPDALSLRQLARRAGVSSGAPYRHFADKNALLAAVASQGFALFDSELEACTAATRSLDPLDRVSRLGVVYVRFAADHPRLFRLMFGPTAPPIGFDEHLDAARRRSAEHLPNALAAVQDAGLARDLALEELTELAWALVHGVAALHLDGLAGKQAIDAQRMAERVTAHLSGLLRA